MFCTEIVHILLCCIGLCVYFQHEPICELISLNCVPADLKLVSRGCRSCSSIHSRWWFCFAVSPFPAVRACPLSVIFNLPGTTERPNPTEIWTVCFSFLLFLVPLRLACCRRLWLLLGCFPSFVQIPRTPGNYQGICPSFPSACFEGIVRLSLSLPLSLHSVIYGRIRLGKILADSCQQRYLTPTTPSTLWKPSLALFWAQNPRIRRILKISKSDASRLPKARFRFCERAGHSYTRLP